MFADDSDNNRFVIAAYLTNYSIEIEMAVNGLEAYEKFKAGQYDLVLMDIQMPIMDGYESLAKIREWEKINSKILTPIIATTAHAFQEDIQKSIDAGFTDHLSKPIRKKKLLTVMGKYIEIIIEHPGMKPGYNEKRNAATHNLTDKPEPNYSMNFNQPDKTDQKEIIIIKVDPVLKKHVSLYQKNLLNNTNTITNAIEQDDFETIRILGHTMKGEGSTFGFHGVTEIGGKIEIAAEKKEFDKIADLNKNLINYLKNVEIQ